MKAKVLSGAFDWRGAKLVREDWDFTACDDWQRRACLEYELCRESVHVRAKAGQFRKQYPAAAIENRWLGACALHGLPSAVLIPDFPRLPWLCLPRDQRAKWIVETQNVWLPRDDKKRQRMIETKDFQADKIMALDETAVKNLQVDGVIQDARFDYDAEPLQSFHVFKVNWRYSNLQLKEQFARWLENRRPEDAKPVEKRGGTSNAEILKVIGARRLLLAYGMDKAEAITFDVLGKPLYSGASAWSRAKHAAEKAILAMPSVDR